MCSGSCAPRPAEAGETGRGAGASPRATQRSETGRYPHKDTVQLLAEPLQLAMPDTWPGACRLADLYAHQLGRTGLRIRAYSAIRNSTTQRSDHTQRPRLFGTVAEPPLLCQEAGRIAWMSAIRI